MRRRIIAGQRGFSLIEMIIATALIGVVAVALIAVLASGVRGVDTVAQRATALQLARSQIEAIKNATYTEPIAYSTITPPNNDFAISVTGTVVTAGYLEKVSVSVTYPAGTTVLDAYKGKHFPPILADKPLPPPAPACPSGATCFAYYLHNNPTPPTGNTNAQANLSMDTTSRVSYEQFNYDVDRNNDVGLTISKGGSGATETDLGKYQNWRTTAFGSSFHIQGDVAVHLWGASANFQLNRKGEVKVFLRDYSGAAYTEIANVTFLLADWQAGFSNFILAEVEIPSVDYTIAAGHYLEVKLLVGSNSQTSTMWFDYDFVDFESIVYIPTVTP